MDLSTLYPREQCACGSWLRKMAPFAGRADNMVKLRGVNVWPEAVGDIAMSVDGVDARLVRARRARTRTATSSSSSVVSERATRRRSPSSRDAVETRLKERLGVRHRAPRSWRPARSTR